METYNSQSTPNFVKKKRIAQGYSPLFGNFFPMISNVDDFQILKPIMLKFGLTESTALHCLLHYACLVLVNSRIACRYWSQTQRSDKREIWNAKFHVHPGRNVGIQLQKLSKLGIYLTNLPSGATSLHNFYEMLGVYTSELHDSVGPGRVGSENLQERAGRVGSGRVQFRQ